jgi:ABC-type lipoprotein release transport system permease subunit
MSVLRLVLASLRHRAGTHLGVLLGAILATAVLVGALAVGDSVRGSLREMALTRLSGVHLALHTRERFFRDGLGRAIGHELRNPTAAVVLLRGTATVERADGSGGELRAGQVQVLGVDEAFWNIVGGGLRPDDGVLLGGPLARTLNARIGDSVLLRIDKPGLLSRDAPLSTIEDATTTVRVPVTGILPDDHGGAFRLDATQVPPLNAILTRTALQKAIAMDGRANTLLVGLAVGSSVAPSSATAALWKNWQLADSQLELRRLSAAKALELRTERVFLDPPIADAAAKAYPGAQGTLTYFVNGLRHGTQETPYSAVSAVQGDPVPAGMRDDEILINQWLADDLGAKVGSTVTLRYWRIGPMRRLEEHTSAFRVRAILPMAGAALDPERMPQIPGLSDKKNCRDWEPGVPIDLKRIRDKDEAYWDRFRGTPKAFLTLSAGQKLWDNRFGNLTAVRYPLSPTTTPEAVTACLRQSLSPASLGLFFVPVRELALSASADSLDFGQLFLGFSLFLIVASLLLCALLFALGVERRSEELGVLRAVGWTPAQIRALLLGEGGVLALLGGLLGTALATLYTRAVIGGLSGVWRGAVAGSALHFYVNDQTLVGGAALAFAVSLLAIFLVTRAQGRQPIRVLLAGLRREPAPTGRRPGRFPAGIPTAVGAGILALGLGIAGRGARHETAAGLFFGAGALLLIAGLAVCRWLLSDRLGQRETLGITGLGLRGAARRRERSLSAIALLACGSFLVVAVGANRQDPAADAQERGSGTGGFALYAESSLPLYQDLTTPEGRDAFALDPATLEGVGIVPLRLREGDDASCLNLNRPQRPRLLGVDPRAFATRRAFADDSVWQQLDRSQPDGAIPAIGDTNTVVWSLGKGVGATVSLTDERGVARTLRIVAVLPNSVLQGGLIVSERRFMELYPQHSGYQVFLLDVAPARLGVVATELTRGLEDIGLSIVPTAERLAAFSTVENTYLSIFAVLGGLGLLLGSAGLGVIVLRNVWERRSEFALLRAVGLPLPLIYRLVFLEHALLLVLGLSVGIVAALLAIVPTMQQPGAHIPWQSLSLTLLAVFASGFVWVALATRRALQGPLLDALRDE